jgi:hypothetical protein
MLKTSDTRIQRINATTSEMLITFEDIELKPEQFTYLKGRLDSFKLYLNSEYLTKFECNYDKTSEQLLIELTLIIHYHLIPKDITEDSDVSNDIVNLFKIFYEAQNEIYKKNYQNSPESFKIK